MNAKSNLFSAVFALLLSTVAVGSAVMPGQLEANSNGAVIRA